jgi:hypothetical protein
VEDELAAEYMKVDNVPPLSHDGNFHCFDVSSRSTFAMAYYSQQRQGHSASHWHATTRSGLYQLVGLLSS